ncbi:outer membrane protein assembly factor BamB family protein [Flindersiella endophytica]
MRNPPRRTAAAALLVTAALATAAAAGCSGDEAPAREPARPERTAPRLDLSGDPKAPPALAFDLKPLRTIPVGRMETPPVTLYGKAVWIADEAGLTMVDATNGRTVTRIKPRHKPLYEAASPAKLTKDEGEQLQYRVLPPQVTRIDGEPAALAVVPVELEPRGSGTPQHGFEVIAAGAADGKVLWRLPIDVDGEPEGRLGASVWRPPYDGKAALQWTIDGGLRGTIVIGLDKPRVLWQRTDFELIDGYADAVVGFRDNGDDTYSVSGASLEDGRDLWTLPDLTGAISAGGRYDEGYGGGPWTLVKDDSGVGLVETTTGRTALNADAGLNKDMTCGLREGGTAVLCASKQAGALALDVKSGKVLWRRQPGNGPGRWSGTVSTIAANYAYVDRPGGPAVVDVRTGKVAGARPGILPDRANAYAGLVFTGTDVEIHLAETAEGGRS